MEFVLSWKIPVLLGLQIVIDLLNCYLETIRTINGKGPSYIPIIPIFLTLFQVIGLEFLHPDILNFFQICIVVILSVLIHFGLSNFIPHLIGIRFSK